MDTLIRGEGITKTYSNGDLEVNALRGTDFTVYEGEFVVILGPSGSGKSTLLNIIGGLDIPTSGRLSYRDEDITCFDQTKLTRYRRDKIGFVFQFYNLMPNLTARENIKLAADVSDSPLDIDKLLDDIDLSDRAKYFPSQLSGGQQQRIAIARAMVKNPELLLCDEPTGALDLATGLQVLKVLSHFNRKYSKTTIIITHNSDIAKIADRVFIIKDGTICTEETNKTPAKVEDIQW